MGTTTEAATACSTSLTAAVGNDAEKLQWIVVNQVVCFHSISTFESLMLCITLIAVMSRPLFPFHKYN